MQELRSRAGWKNWRPSSPWPRPEARGRGAEARAGRLSSVSDGSASLSSASASGSVATTRRVTLTEVGTLYCRQVQALLDELASAGRKPATSPPARRAWCGSHCPVSFGRHWIAPLLPAFLARHPQIRIDLRLTDRFVDVVAEGIDVAIRVAADMPRDSSLTTRKIASYRNLLVASPGYLDVHGTPQLPADLARPCLPGVHRLCRVAGLAADEGWEARDAASCLRPRAPASRKWCSWQRSRAPAITFTADWLAGPALRTGALVEVLPGWAARRAAASTRSCRPAAWFRRRRVFSSTRSLGPSKRGGRAERLSRGRAKPGAASASRRSRDTGSG